MVNIHLYTTPYCGYCRAAKHLPNKKSAPFTEIDVSEDMEQRQEMIERAFGRRTVSRIFINSIRVGVYYELVELKRLVKLDALLGETDAAVSAPGD